MITQKKLQQLVSKWGKPSYIPKFRFATCADCGRKLFFGMWHIFLKAYGNKREIHLCGKCGHKYNLDTD